MNQSYTDKYKIVDQFNTAYWSGYDTKVKLGGILLEESTQVAYQLLERVQPYYHYSSYIPTRFNHGTRIIAGEISMNFKQAGYLYALIQHFQTREDSYPITPDINTPINVTRPSGASLSDPKALSNYIRQYELSQRAEDSTIALIRERTTPNVNNNQGMFETLQRMDLDIIMGDSIDPSQILETNNGSDFVSRATALTSKKRTPVTGRRLENVHFLGLATMCDDSGRPIMETLSFQAANVAIIES